MIVRCDFQVFNCIERDSLTTVVLSLMLGVNLLAINDFREERKLLKK